MSKEEEAALQAQYRDFENNLDFNAWNLEPAYEKTYKDVITKDVALSNLRTKEHFTKGFNNLRLAVYLDKIKKTEHEGWLIRTDHNEEGYELQIKSFEEAIKIIPKEEKVLSAVKIMVEKPVFPKSVHNKKSTAYTLFSMTRGINGKASNDINTVRQEQQRTLRDETERKSGFLQKKSPKWVDYEKQKNW